MMILEMKDVTMLNDCEIKLEYGMKSECDRAHKCKINWQILYIIRVSPLVVFEISNTTVL